MFFASKIVDGQQIMKKIRFHQIPDHHKAGYTIRRPNGLPDLGEWNKKNRLAEAEALKAMEGQAD